MLGGFERRPSLGLGAGRTGDQDHINVVIATGGTGRRICVGLRLIPDVGVGMPETVDQVGVGWPWRVDIGSTVRARGGRRTCTVHVDGIGRLERGRARQRHKGIRNEAGRGRRRIVGRRSHERFARRDFVGLYHRGVNRRAALVVECPDRVPVVGRRDGRTGDRKSA